MLSLAKIIALEKNIGQHPTDWLNRMVLVGDTSSSGISTIYTNRYIRDISKKLILLILILRSMVPTSITQRSSMLLIKVFHFIIFVVIYKRTIGLIQCRLPYIILTNSFMRSLFLLGSTGNFYGISNIYYGTSIRLNRCF